MNLSFSSKSNKLVILILFLVFNLFISTSLNAAMTFGATQSMSLSQKTCYSNNSNLTYSYIVTPTGFIPRGTTFVCGTNFDLSLTGTSFSLKRGVSFTGETVITKKPTASEVICNTTTGNITINGAFDLSTLSPGIYTVYSSITAIDKTGGISTPVLLPTYSYTFTVGYQASWTNLTQMVALPNTYSAYRNVTGATYGSLNSMNKLLTSSNSGWIDLGAQINTTSTTGSVFIVLTKVSSFTPNSGTLSYIEFRRKSTGTGTDVYIRNGSAATLTLISGLTKDSRIRVEKSGTTLKFYTSNTVTQIVGSPTILNFTGELSLSVFAANISEGVKDVISSYSCESSQTDQFAHLKYDIDGYYHTFANKIRFIFNQEYDASTLKFNIYNSKDIKIKDQTNFPVQALTYGDNYITIDCADPTRCIGRGFFYLEVINDKKEVMYLRFFNDVGLEDCMTIQTQPK
jgi:hypothetical protein